MLVIAECVVLLMADCDAIQWQLPCLRVLSCRGGEGAAPRVDGKLNKNKWRTNEFEFTAENHRSQ